MKGHVIVEMSTPPCSETTVNMENVSESLLPSAVAQVHAGTANTTNITNPVRTNTINIAPVGPTNPLVNGGQEHHGSFRLWSWAQPCGSFRFRLEEEPMGPHMSV